MSRKRKPIDPTGRKAVAFKRAQVSRRAERRAYQQQRWAEYDDSNTMGMLGLILLIAAGLLIAYVRLNGSLF